MSRLVVYLNGQRTGLLSQAEDAVPTFSYDPSYLTAQGAAPLSRQLPLQAQPFAGRVVRAFFGGILPEADVRSQVASILGISAENDMGMMERIGGECAGAVALFPPEIAPALSGTSRQQWLSEEELASVIRELPRHPLLAGREGIRLSLAGAQTKVPIVLPAAGFRAPGVAALPLDGTPSTHIIKPEPARFPGLAANEAYCMALARAVGLSAAETEWRMIGDTPCLIIRRYDRTESPDGTITRSHQEDFCQAMGILAEHKYQQEGGPSLPDCIALLRSWSTVPVLDVRAFLDAVIFGALIGNADAHGKNFSFLYAQDSRRLAPLYDQVCTMAWPELSQSLSMKIGSAATLSEISPEHFLQLASRSGLSAPLTRERLADMSERIYEAASSNQLHIPEQPSLENLRTLILARAERMTHLLKR